MMKFSKKYCYDKDMDIEVIGLCNVMNSLPGIKTFESCSGHNKTSFRIYFKFLNDKDGLVFLTRCVDIRYWKYGKLWNIQLSMDDIPEDNPITFCLSSGLVIGKDAYEQSKDLIRNMEYHLNHKNFIRTYNINLDSFDIER